MTLDPRAKEVLDYWFGDLDQTPDYFLERNRMWFMGGVEVDSEIRTRFESWVVEAAEGRLESWASTPRGCLALIILLDQFSLNLYREQPRSYLQSELAIPIVRKVIQMGWEFVLTPAEKVFLYLPLEHSEKLSDQEEAVARFALLAQGTSPDLRPAMDIALDYAIRHWKVVKTYGRFPDRNEVFGRKSTPEEERFLASSEAPF